VPVPAGGGEPAPGRKGPHPRHGGVGIPWARGGATHRQHAQTDGAPDAMEQGQRTSTCGGAGPAAASRLPCGGVGLTGPMEGVGDGDGRRRMWTGRSRACKRKEERRWEGEKK